jgi:predicted nucleic acid-binding protein
VIRRETKYALDTNLFIQAFRDRTANTELQRFHRGFAPFEYLSAIVIQELRAGIRSARDKKKLERYVLNPFLRAHRVVTPSLRAWTLSGDVLARFAVHDGVSLGSVSKAFGNDVLLALSCREAGMVLVTSNVRDFGRIQRFVRFRFVKPWPTPSA